METDSPLRMSQPLTPTARRSLADDVADRLRDAILSGSFQPGEPLREEQLAASLDVSRGPVREALVQLEREGLVIVRRHRGATVARLSQADAEEVYSLRLALERLAVQRAVVSATEADFAAMEDILDAFRAASIGEPSAKEIADLDVRFHDLIYRAAHHQRLYDCWANLRSQTFLFLLSRNVANADFREVTVQSHKDLLDVLRSRDPVRAGIEIENHLLGAYERVVQGLRQQKKDDL
jgi:DNA-binding GntR family transcriptional regulator